MKKKSAIIIAIILMSIGFASISTTLIINGNANVSENNEDFSVIFTAASLDGNDVYSTAVDETKKTITFTTGELKTLNQTSILTYEVTNNSSNYDANVTVTCVPSTGTTAKYTSIKNKLDNDATVVKAKETLNGTLTVTLDKVATESVTEEYTCKLEFNAVERDTLGEHIPEPVSFTSDSWKTIQKAVQTGNTSKYNVGDTKEVDLGELGKHTVRIANMSECTNGETSETACGFVVEFVDMIATLENYADQGANRGGWISSQIRAYLNRKWLKSFPTDLQQVIATTKVISGHGPTAGETNFETQDKLYLLSSEEIYSDFSSSSNSQHDTSVGTSKQLDYYKNQGVTTSNYAGAIKQYNGSDKGWWLRTADAKYDIMFLSVDKAGGFDLYDFVTSVDFGVSPAFRIA